MDYKDENMWLMLGDCLERMKESVKLQFCILSKCLNCGRGRLNEGT